MSQPHLTCPGNELVHERLSDAGVPMLGEDKDIADVSPRPSAQPACYRHAVVALDVRHADGCTTHLDQKERSGPALRRPPLTKRGVEAGVVDGAADALFVPGATEIGEHTNIAIARDSGRDAHSSLFLYSVEGGGHPREEIIARASLDAGSVCHQGMTVSWGHCAAQRATFSSKTSLVTIVLLARATMEKRSARPNGAHTTNVWPS
jgi:hypothetical protein